MRDRDDVRAEPIYFGPDERPLFGWLHRPAAPSALGVVLCPPFGYEAICSHRSVRHFAEAAAAAGIPALRFDFDGTGDSAGDERDSGRLAAQVASVRHAIATLRAMAGVERVALLGIRLGALIAALAAEGQTAVDGLIAIAPVISGKPYLRELRALEMSVASIQPPAGVEIEAEIQPALGFSITRATATELSAVNLARAGSPPAPAVLLIERDDLPASDEWPNALAAAGVAVQRRRLPGYVEMMMDPDKAAVPTAMIAAATEWLSGRAGVRLAPPPAALPPRAQARVAAGVVERTVAIDAAGTRLFGICSVPEGEGHNGVGVLLLNAGSIHRVGPNRLYTRFARRWAAAGCTVLRIDMAGIGDSPAVPGQPENVVYTDSAIDEIAAVLEFLRAQPGVREIHAVGLCSGGYNAFKAAVRGVRLDGVVVINPLTFFYKAEQAGEQSDHRVMYGWTHYVHQLRNLDAWRKLLAGRAQYRKIGELVIRRVEQLARSGGRTLARRLGVRLEDDLAGELERIAQSQVKLRFVFAASDPGMGLLRAGAGAAVDRLRGRGAFHIDVIDGPDHTFTPLWSHRLLGDVLDAHLGQGARRLGDRAGEPIRAGGGGALS